MSAIIEKTFEKAEFINGGIDTLAEFVINHPDIKDDYEEYYRTIGGDNVAMTIPYIFERRLESKSIMELYLEKNKRVAKDKKALISAFANNISSVFEVKKIAKNRFELYNLVNEKTYSVTSPIKMSAFRGLGVGYYIAARIFNYENENYIIEVLGVYPSSKKDLAYKFAISKIISNPELVYKDNDEMKAKIEKKVEFSYNRFIELFGVDELTTSNRYADELIEYLNGSTLELDWKSKIEDVEVKKYFDVSSSASNIFQNGGFSSATNKYDVTLLVDKTWGFYAIPFYKTFCNLFEGKEVQDADKMVEYFLTTTGVTRNILERVYNKYPNFMEVINKFRNTKMTFDELLNEYKSEQSYACATVLEESAVFATVYEMLAEEENKVEVQKVGRNDPCPCGSGKKYKKCCGR